MAKKEDKRGLWLKTLTEQLSTGADQKILQHLHALQAKYARDYLQFFQNISKNYQKGRIKEQADNAIDTTQRILFLLSRIEETREISKKNEKEIPELSETLSQYKEFFSAEQEGNKRFQKILENIAREKGVTFESLGVTPGMSSQVLQETKMLTQKKPSFFEGRFAESPWHLGRGLQAATLGPFSQTFDVSKAALKGVGGVGRGLLKGLRGRRKQRASSDLLRTLVASGRQEEIQKVGTGVPGPDLVQSNERTHPLMDFFDVGAYKAKWTKELLEVTKKNTERTARLDGASGLSSLFNGLKEGILPFIGRAGLLAGLAVAVAAVTPNFVRLGGAISDYLGSKKEEKAAADREAKSTADRASEIKQRLEKKDLVSQKELVDLNKARFHTAKSLYESLPSWNPSKILMQMGILPSPYAMVNPQIQKTLELQNQIQEVDQRSSESRSLPTEVKATVSKEDIESIVKGAVEIMKQQSSQTLMQQPAPRLVNINDSGDVLLREHAKGNLSLEE